MVVLVLVVRYNHRRRRRRWSARRLFDVGQWCHSLEGGGNARNLDDDAEYVMMTREDMIRNATMDASDKDNDWEEVDNVRNSQSGMMDATTKEGEEKEEDENVAEGGKRRRGEEMDDG
jgi:hypothetical protein